MTKHQGQTDKLLKIQLKSLLQTARWGAPNVASGGRIPIEVGTAFVADGSAVKIAVKDAEGVAIETVKGKVWSNQFRVLYVVSKPNKTGGMFFEAELPAHGLKALSGRVQVFPPTPITDLKWIDSEGKAPKEIHPKEQYTLHARIQAIPAFKEASITVYAKEGKADPILITGLSGEIKDGVVEVIWECPARLKDPHAGKPHSHEPPDLSFEIAYLGTKAVSPKVPFAPTLPMLVLEVEDALFSLDSAVFLPSAPSGPSGADGDDVETANPNPAASGASGLGVVATLFQYLNAHEGKFMVIAGHTDTSGGVQYNFGLSEKRGKALLAVIENDRDTWKATCQPQHRVEDYQQILAHWKQRLGWDCDPGPVDGALGDKTKKALQNFRDKYNASKADLKISQPDLPAAALGGEKLKAEYWGAFFDLYQYELAEGMGVDAAGLDAYRKKVKFVDDGKKVLGCGESFPIEKPKRDNYRSQTNRRVEILLFDEEEKPDLACPAARATVHTPKECPVYGLLKYKPSYLTPLWVIHFTIFDEDLDLVDPERPWKYAIRDREKREVKKGTFVQGTQITFFGDPLERYLLVIEGEEVAYIDSGTGGPPPGAGAGIKAAAQDSDTGEDTNVRWVDEEMAELSDDFDEQIQLLDETTGAPIAGCPFYAEKDGKKFLFGYTDDEGKTPRFATQEGESELTVYWGDEALVKEGV